LEGAQQGRDLQVLYVEDDIGMARIVERMLQDAGYRCDTTGLGKRAVTLGQQNAYDLILLDVMLPDIDGYEVIKQLRDADVETPFLIQSGLLDRNRVTDGLGFGVADFLIKPFNKSELLERIDTVIKRSKKAATPAPEPPLDSPEDRQEPAVERRRHRRFATEMSAEILHKGRIDCVVLNISHGGAAIRLPDATTQCPPSFALKLSTGDKRHCLQCWRYGDKVGVKFL
jgi:DNA-binding response OmpR family regulator